MGRVVVLFSLTLMIVGILLALAGTQHSSTVRLLECFDSLCYYEISLQPNFTVNYFGMALSVLGAAGFVFTYSIPPKQNHAKIQSIQLSTIDVVELLSI